MKHEASELNKEAFNFSITKLIPIRDGITGLKVIQTEVYGKYQNFILLLVVVVTTILFGSMIKWSVLRQRYTLLK